jgi:Tfp pilus assembly protein PilV
MNSRPSKRYARNERGVALVEIMIAIIMLAGVILSLAAASGHAARQIYLSRRDMHLWATLQSQAESLRAVGYQGVSDGSGTVDGHAVAWTVAGTDPKTVTVVLTYETRKGTSANQTFTVYFPASDTL